MKMIEITDKALAEPTLKRMVDYVATGKAMLRAGAKTASWQQMADALHMDAADLMADLVPNPRLADAERVVDMQSLVVDIERILLRGEREAVIVAGTRERVGRLINSWEFAGYNFLIDAVYCTGGIPAHAMQYEMLETDDELTEWSETATPTTAVIDAGFEQAQTIAEKMVEAGITHIWNFSPVVLKVPLHVEVENVIPGYPKWKSKPAPGHLN
jgi:NADH/NAD ratio-sensing transcriptional regulator Rex